MVRIRLKRMGRRHRASYRLTVVDGRATRDGRALEELGYYDPANQNPALRLNLNKERIEYWLGVGAQPSDTARDLLRQSGIATGKRG